MKRLVLLPALLALAVTLFPASAGAAPFGGESNPIGTLRWIPTTRTRRAR